MARREGKSASGYALRGFSLALKTLNLSSNRTTKKERQRRKMRYTYPQIAL